MNSLYVLKGLGRSGLLPGWIFKAIGVAEGGVRSGQNLPCFSLGSIGAGALPRGVGTANCGDLPLFAPLCRLHWPFMEMKMGAARRLKRPRLSWGEGGGSTFFYRTKPISRKSFTFILSSPFRACPIGTCQGISGRSQFARQSAESQQWLAKAPAQWEREGLRASSRFRLAYRRLNGGHWLVGNGNVLVCAPEPEHRPDPKIENIEPWATPDPWHSKRGGSWRNSPRGWCSAAQTAVVSASFPNTRKRAAAGRRAADLLKIDSKAVVGDVGDDAAVQTRRAE